MDGPLRLDRLLEHGSTVHASCRIDTVPIGSSIAQRVTFAEIGDQARRLAAGLKELGIRPGQRVCTLMWNNAEHVATALAVPAMGAVLHPLDVGMYSEEVASAVKQAADRIAIVDHDLLPEFAQLLPRLRSIQRVVINGPADVSVLEGTGVGVDSYADLQAAHEPAYDWPERAESDAALLCAASGLTGRRGAVVYSHRSTYLHALSTATPDAMGVSADDRILVAGAQFHTWAWGLPYLAFLTGASLILLPSATTGAELAEIIGAASPTKAIGPAEVWNELAGYLAERPSTDLGSLSEVMTDRNAATPSLVETLTDRGVGLTSVWAMSAAGPVGLFARQSADYDGRLIAPLEARLRGAEGENLPWDGESTGELEIRGPWIVQSMFGDDEDVAEAGWFRTGEFAVITPEGYLRIMR